jgi:hypothetical protein
MECDVAEGHDSACPVITKKYHQFELGLHDYWDGKTNTSSDATYLLGRQIAQRRDERSKIRTQPAAT